MQLCLQGGVLAPTLPIWGQERGSSRHITGTQGSGHRAGPGPPATPRVSARDTRGQQATGERSLPNRQVGAWLHVWREWVGGVSPVSPSPTRMAETARASILVRAHRGVGRGLPASSENSQRASAHHPAPHPSAMGELQDPPH